MGRFLTNRWIHFFLLFSILLTAAYYNGADNRWRNEMQALVFDELNATFPRERGDTVLIVDVDDDSLTKIGQWPWPRTVHADLIANLTEMGAKVIAFDGVLAEPDRTSPQNAISFLSDTKSFEALKDEIATLPDHDEVLAEAIRESGIFVSAFTEGTHLQETRKPKIVREIVVKPTVKKRFLNRSKIFQQTAMFLPNLEGASAGNGSFMAIPDFDGVLRNAGLVFTDKHELYPSLSLEAIRVAQRDPKIQIKIGPNKEAKSIDTNFRISVGQYEIPVENNGLLHVYYRIFDEDDYLSAHKVLDVEGREDIAEKVNDKIILIGSSAEGLKDLRSTALEAFQPGVEIHANVIEQILQNEYLLRPDIMVRAEDSFILFAGLLMIILAPFVHVLVLAFVCFTMIAAAFLGSAVAYVDYKILLDPFYPSLSVFVIFIVSTLLTYLRVESEKHQVRNAFGMYVSRDVMRDLEKNPDKLKLGGENKDLTVMFTDIRSFTTISEGLTPEELIHLMNDFLTAMSDIVMTHEGTIDKYMGDAMMAFWNAPKDVEGHERKACLAALKMQAALDPINAELAKRAAEKGEEPVMLQAGIGLNTGMCAVGNMGSHQRFAYSSLGDAVNLASRLEGQTKNYGVQTLIGENTCAHTPDLATLEIDLVQVKGKTQPARIFALLGDEALAASPEFQALKEPHEAMIAAYQSGEFKAAQEALKSCKQLDKFELSVAYDLYEQRITELLKNPPSGEWTGVYEAKTK